MTGPESSGETGAEGDGAADVNSGWRGGGGEGRGDERVKPDG